MTKVIIIPDEDLDTFYERTMQYLHAKYHTYPSTLTGPQITNLSENVTAILNYTSNQNYTQHNIPIGKFVA